MRELLTHSRMQSFLTCRKKHWYEYELCLRKQVDAKALRMGSASHAGLDVLKQGRPVEEAMVAVTNYYGMHANGIYDDWDFERVTVETLVWGWYHIWSKQHLDIVATERSMQSRLRNPETSHPTPLFDLAGKIDGIVRLPDGRLSVLEHKTISDSVEPNSDYWQRLQLDGQITIYILLARASGYPVETVLYDVIRKPSIRPELVTLLDEDGSKIVLDGQGDRVFKKDGSPRQTGDPKKGYTLQTRMQTYQEWQEKLALDISHRPDYYYARVEIARLDSDLKEMRYELWDIQQALQDAKRHNRWYKTVRRDTCGFCPYFGLCSSRYDFTGEAPEGFVLLNTSHPELEDAKHGEATSTTETTDFEAGAECSAGTE